MPIFYGFKVTPAEAQMLNATVTIEQQAGWKPTRADIKELIRSDCYPSKEEQDDMKKFDEEMDKSYQENKR